MKVNQIGTLPIQIGAAMLAGVLYVGVGVDAFQRMLVRSWCVEAFRQMKRSGQIKRLRTKDRSVSGM